MNNELLNVMNEKISCLKDSYNNKAVDFEMAKKLNCVSEVRRICGEMNKIAAEHNEVLKDKKDYKNGLANEADLCKKYNVYVPVSLDEEVIDTIVNEKVKSNQKVEKDSKLGSKVAKCVVSSALAVTSLVGAFHLGRYGTSNILRKNVSNAFNTKNNNESNGDVTNESEETELPFECYGNFTDATDEAQLKARATWIVDNYDLEGKTFATQLEKDNYISTVMNYLRYINGQLMLDSDGNVVNNAEYVDKVAEFISDITDANSYADDDYHFVPSAPFFIDGSSIQTTMIEYDKVESEMVDAMNEGNDCKFMQLAQKFGYMFLSSCVYPNMYKETAYLNLYQNETEKPTQYYALQFLLNYYSNYISNYQRCKPVEYVDADGVVTKSEYAVEGDRFLDICLNYCVMYGVGEDDWKSLSSIINNYNYVLTDDNAKMAGIEDGIIDGKHGMTWYLGEATESYFNSAYENQNYTKSLK